MYYSNTIPNIGDIVFVKYKSSTDDGAYVSLIEYDDLEGFILITELTKYKVRPDKIFKTTKLYPCYVLDTDSQKRTVDLSYKKIKQEQHKPLESIFFTIQRFRKIFEDLKGLKLVDDDILASNTLNLLFDHTTLAETNAITGEKLEIERTYDEILDNPSLFFKGKDLDPHIVERYIDFMKSHITNSGVEFYKEFTMTILESNAPEKIKLICENMNVGGVHLIYMSPHYRICITAPTEKEGEEKLIQTENILTTEMKKYNTVHQFADPVVYTKKRSVKYS
jgi:translation initiation factor 2 alpha subunit (eIF-2alpha)